MNFSNSIAVIGSGVAGLTCAYILSRQYPVVLFESNDRLGGHTHTVMVPGGDGADVPVDMGFIVFNRRNYPLFLKLLTQLNVAYEKSDMSFSYCDPSAQYYYAGIVPWGLIAQKRNLFRLRFWQFLLNLPRFNRLSKSFIQHGVSSTVTLGDFLKEAQLPESFVRDYVYAMGSAIWSSGDDDISQYPALSFLKFWDNHGLLGFDQPQWYTVSGGSQMYVRQILERSDRLQVRLSTPIRQISRRDDGVEIVSESGEPMRFSKVVIATHADTAFRLLSDATDLERSALSAWRYSKNRVMLHTDVSMMPPRRRAWAAWNYRDDNGQGVGVTYYMNRLQNLNTPTDYFVTLNGAHLIDPQTVLHDTVFTHPIYTPDTVATQSILTQLNANGPLYFCGSYFGYGFHEDAVRSAVAVCERFGLAL